MYHFLKPILQNKTAMNKSSVWGYLSNYIIFKTLTTLTISTMKKCKRKKKLRPRGDKKF